MPVPQWIMEKVLIRYKGNGLSQYEKKANSKELHYIPVPYLLKLEFNNSLIVVH